MYPTWEIFLLPFTSAKAALEAEILSNNPTITIIKTDVMEWAIIRPSGEFGS